MLARASFPGKTEASRRKFPSFKLDWVVLGTRNSYR